MDVARLSRASYSGADFNKTELGSSIMVMQAMHSGKGSKVVKLFFFALLILAAGGLVLTDVGGFFRGGVSQSDVAKVGDKTISIASFDRTTRRTLARMNMAPQQAYEMGYVNRILSSEIRRLAFQQVGQDFGIRIGREMVARQINDMISPQLREGQNKQQAFEMILQQQGFTEPEFINVVASEATVGLLGKALQNQYLGASEALAQDLYQYQNESRNVEFITFLHSDYDDVEQPSDVELEKLYQATKENYAIPETRNITVGIIKDDALKSSIEVTEERVRDIYDDEIASFTIPEERVLEQAVFETESEAQNIADAIQDGQSMKTAIKETTGNEDAYLGEQAFQQDGLIEDISAAVFASDETGKVFGPVESPLGWHVVVLKDIKEPHTKPFESVKDTIKNEILQMEFADQKYAIAGEIDDMLAGGASLEEVKQSYPMDTTTIKGVTSIGAMASQNNPLDQFGEDATLITQLSFESFEGESAPVTELGDGRTAIVQVNKVTEKSYVPFEEVKDEIREKWVNDQKRASNTNFLKELLLTAKTEERSLQAIANEHDKSVLTAKNLKRNEELKSPMTQIGIAQIFKTGLDSMIVFDIENGLAIGKVTSFDYPELADIDEETLEPIQKASMQDAAEESIAMFYENKVSDMNIEVNEAVIKRLYGPSENNM